MPAYNQYAFGQKVPRAALVLFATLLLLSSCVTSQYPLAAKESDIIFREDLVGSWKEKEGKSQFVVEKGEGPSYGIIQIDVFAQEGTPKTDTSYFKAQLVQVGKLLFLDIVMDTLRMNDKDSEAADRSAGHFIVAIDMKGKDKIVLASIKKDKLEQLLNDNKFAMKHSSEGDDILLLEPSASLQQRLAALRREHPEVWEKSELKRK